MIFLLSIGFLLSFFLLFIIHFFGVRIRKSVEFSQTQFLNSVIVKSRAVRAFKNRLLFIVRALAIFLFALFIFFFIEDLRSSQERSGHSVVIVDDSWSMLSNYYNSRQNKLQQVFQMLNNSVSSIGGSSVRTSSGLIMNIDSFKSFTPSFFQPNSNGSLLKNYSSRNREYIVMSDFQRGSLSTPALKAIADVAPLRLVNLSNIQERNIYIDSIWLDNPVGASIRTTKLMVRLSSVGFTEQVLVKIRLMNEDVQVGSSIVPMNSTSPSVTNFNIKTNKDPLELTLSIEDSYNIFDNQFFLVLPGSKEKEIAVFPVLKNNSSIIKALGEEPGFKVVNHIKQGAQVWIFQPNTNISSTTRFEVINWLKKGKSIIILPSVSSATSIVELMRGLGVKNITSRPEVKDGLVLTNPDFSDPFFHDIFERKGKKISMPKLSPLLYWHSSFHSILSFEDKSPFLSLFKIGDGQVYLFSAPLEGSDFEAHPLFVPVLYQTLLKSDAGLPLAFAGDTKSISFPLDNNREGETLIELRKGKDIFILEQQWRNNVVEFNIPEQVNEPGFYDLFKDGTYLTTIAINIPASESNLASYSNDELGEIFKDTKFPVEVIQPNESNSLEKVLEKKTLTTDLAKYCLILCLLLLLVEIFILRNRKSGSPS